MGNIFRFFLILYLCTSRLLAGWLVAPAPTAIDGSNVVVKAEVDLGSTFAMGILWVQAPNGTWTWSAILSMMGTGTRSGFGSRVLSAPGTWTWQLRTSASAPHGATTPTGTLHFSGTTEVTAKTATTFTFSNLSHTHSGSLKTASVTPNPADASYTTDLTKGPGIGSYTVTATATGTFSGSGSATLVISEGSPLAPSSDLVGTLPGSVSVDNKGSANYSIPLTIAPGRGGLQPSLSLSYSSSGGNGPLGLGWSLSYGPSKISRGRSILARDGYVQGMSANSDDRLYLDGRLLVVVNNTSTEPDAYWQVGNVYRTEVDSFVKITALGLNGALTSTVPTRIEAFKVEGKDGSVSYFGRIDDNSADALRAFYGGGNVFFDWAIKRTVDAVGNSLEYTYNNYRNDKIDYLSEVVGRASGEQLLAGIDYTANPGAGIAASFGVRLIYTPSPTLPLAGEMRRDTYSGYVATRENEAIRRLVKIEAGPLSAGRVDPLVRYDFAYETSPGTNLSRLRGVTFNSKTNGTTIWQTTPPTVFAYNDDGADAPFQNPALTSTPVSAGIALTDPANSAHVATGDFNGDGITDKYFNGKVYLGNGTGFSTGVTWLPPDGNSWVVVKAGDVNGDGLSDLIRFNLSSAYVAISTGSGFATDLGCDLGGASLDADVYNSYPGAAASRCSVGDFDGDGRADILIHQGWGTSNPAGLYVGLSTGSQFSAPVRWGGVNLTDLFYQEWDLPMWTFPDFGQVCHVTPIEPVVADFNGDGIDDYAYIERASAPSGSDSLITCDTSLRVAISRPRYTGLGRLSPTSIQWQTVTLGSNSSIADAPLLKMWPGDCNADGYTDLLVLCERGSVDKWCLFRGTAAGFLDGVSDSPVEDYMVDGPNENWPIGNIDLTIASYFNEYFYAAQGVQTAGMFLQDINKDGYPDFIFGRGESFGGWLVKYGRKDGFSASQQLWTYDQGALVQLGGATPYLDSSGHGGISMEAVDLDGDGASDWLLTTPSAAGGGSQYVIAKGRNAKIDKLIEVTDGVGAKTQIAYKSITDSCVYTPGAAVVYPIREMRGPQLVVSDVWKDSGTGSSSDRAHFSYQYSGRRLDLSGRGDLGFHAFVTLDHQTQLFKYQFLAQSFPMTGLTAREQTYRYWDDNTNVSFRLINSHDNTVVFDEVVNPADSNTPWGTVYPFISKAIESRWENHPSEAHFGPWAKAGSPESKPELLFTKALPPNAHITVSATSRFDDQTDAQTTIPGGYYANDRTADWSADGTNSVKGSKDYAVFHAAFAASGYRKITYGNLKQLSTDFSDGFTETVDTTYLAPVGSLTGLVNTVKTTVVSPVGGTEVAPIKSYTYWGSTPLVATEVVDAAAAGVSNPDPKLSFTTTYVRDTRGRVKETQITGYVDSTAPTTSTTLTVSKVTRFNDRFDLPEVVENAYGHTTTTAYHEFLGLPKSVTDVNGATVETDYDALGRTVQTRDLNLALQSDTTFAWTSGTANDWTKTQTISVPAGAADGLTLSSVYAVRTTATSRAVTGVSMQPPATAYFDRLGRTIRTVREGFGAQNSTIDVIYNKLGQTVAISLPYNPADATTGPFWTCTTYDVLGRVQKIVAPNGTETVNTYVGRATQVSVDAPDLAGVNPPAQINTTYADSKGRTIKVWNADNVPAALDAKTGSTTEASVEYRLDGFGRMRSTVLRGNSAGTFTTVTAKYDALGRQTELNDPDKGLWKYTNNALGQVLKQEDAKHSITVSTFDPLGRPLMRTTTEASSGPVEFANWYYYDTAANVAARPAAHLFALGTQGWIGAPQREESSTAGAPGYAFAKANLGKTATLHYYDSHGRPAIALTNIDDKWFYTCTDYDAAGRVGSVRHFWKPAGHEAPADQPYVWQDFGYSYTYDAKSYLTELRDASGQIWWEVDADAGYDHLDRPVLVRKGHGHWTKRTYRPKDGVLTAIKTGPTAGSATVQNLTFAFDGLGNLTARADDVRGLSESFGYDSLNRLTKRNGAAIVAYAINGNVSSKFDVNGSPSGDYSYAGTQPNAVTSAFGYVMSYDANGNLLTRIRSATGETWATRWAGFDKPRWLAKSGGGTTAGSEFLYNTNRSRVIQAEFDSMTGSGTTAVPAHYTRKRLYAWGSTGEIDYVNQSGTGGPPVWTLDTIRLYVPGPEGVIGAMEFAPNGPVEKTTRPLVYHYDHLGSVDTVTFLGDRTTYVALDDNGKQARHSFDPWGQRRDPDDWSGQPADTTAGGHADVTPRGFTGHEMMDNLDLVNMNGRIYDALLGRFLSADLVVQNPANQQCYNRYSYVQNNPLSLVDPTGFISESERKRRREEDQTITRVVFVVNKDTGKGIGFTITGSAKAVNAAVDIATSTLTKLGCNEKVDLAAPVPLPVDGSISARPPNSEAKGTPSSSVALSMSDGPRAQLAFFDSVSERNIYSTPRTAGKEAFEAGANGAKATTGVSKGVASEADIVAYFTAHPEKVSSIALFCHGDQDGKLKIGGALVSDRTIRMIADHLEDAGQFLMMSCNGAKSSEAERLAKKVFYVGQTVLASENEISHMRITDYGHGGGFVDTGYLRNRDHPNSDLQILIMQSFDGRKKR